MHTLKSITGCIIGGFILAIPPSILFIPVNPMEREEFNIWIPLVSLGIGFSAFIFLCKKGDQYKIQKGWRYAKKGFWIVFILSLMAFGFIFYNAVGVGGLRTDEFLRLTATFLTVSLFIAIPLFLIGYFRAIPKEESRS